MNNNDEQRDELTALTSIYEDDILIDFNKFPYSGSIIINIQLNENIRVGNNLNFYSIEHMPPINLHFDLPSDYPNISPPNFQLKCTWLDQNQISIINQLLISRFQKGIVVLYDWMTLLKEEILQILSITDEIFCHNDILKDILLYNETKLNKIFNMTYFDCQICCNQVIGDQCVRLNICKHIFCKSCLSEFLKIHITEGSVLLVKCPAYECKNELPLNVIKDLIPSDLFERYDNLLLKSSLDLMQDIMYCPRLSCNSCVIIDPIMGLGSCPACLFSFCIHCKQTYHGIEKCNLKSSEMKKIALAYMNGDFEEKNLLEVKYGKKLLENIVEDMMNNSWLHSNTQLCPTCKAKIEKDGGCNKMSCWKCGSYFCWLCGNNIDGYSHFNDAKSKCYNKLFDGLTLDEELI